MREERPAYKIADIDPTERPREKLARHGSERLSNAELLAILIRTGLPGENAIEIGQRLLVEFNGLAGLHRTSYKEVCDQPGIGPAKAAQILAAIELGRRIQAEKHIEPPRISSPEDVADLVQYEMSALEQEEMRVLLLNTRNQVMRQIKKYRGSINSSQVRVAEIFTEAIRDGASSLILIHNHPSGDPSPSPEDIAVTRQIIEAGKLLDIEVLDHLIIGRGPDRYVSLKDRGLGFER